ncbi:MAG: hypothetical protein PHY59_04255, partial [Methanobacterium sp.]|nr:hypothetical protein [Methanobacterium sp.]
MLNGPYNKIKEVPYDDFIKDYTGQPIPGDVNNLRKSSKIVNNQYKIQKNQIKGLIKANYENRKGFTDLRSISLVILAVALAIFLVSVFGAISTYQRQNMHAANARQYRQISNNFYAQALHPDVNEISSIALVGVLHSSSALERVDDLNGIYNNNLTDLNSWAVTGNWTAPVAGCLNFSTHEGCAVNDTLNGTSVYDSP